MSIVWNKSDDRVWFGVSRAPPPLRLVAELLPDDAGWDWIVWRSDDPRTARRGVARSSEHAATAAESVAMNWHEITWTAQG